MKPKAVKKVKFLHCADLHIDCPFSSLPDVIAQSRKQTLKNVFLNIIDIAIREKVDFLFISGDLFEHNYVTLSSINFINECFKKIPDVKIFMTCGNHDPAVSSSHYFSYKWENNVISFKKRISYAYIDEFDAYIYGSSFLSFEEPECFIPNFDPLDKNAINILLSHGTFDFDLDNCKYNPISKEFLDELGMDYIGLGHFHKKFIKGNVYNPGSPEPLGFDEVGPHGVFVGTIDKRESLKIDVEFIPTNVNSYEVLDINIPNITNDLSVIDEIKDKVVKSITNPRDSLTQINIKGYLQKGFYLDTDYIYNSLYNDFFYLNIINNTSPDYDWDALSKEPGLRGLFVAKMLAKIADEPDENKKKILYSAMHYGIQAIDENDVNI